MATKIVASRDEARVIGQQVPGVTLRALEDGRLELFFTDDLAAAVSAVDETDSKPILYEYAAMARWRHEVGGVTVNGIAVSTDERTRGELRGGRIKAEADPNYAMTNWKVAAGEYVTLDAAAIIAISDAVEARIQQCFDANATVDAGIATGAITSEAEVDAAFEAALG